jgi:hypothetical protein
VVDLEKTLEDTENSFFTTREKEKKTRKEW